MKLRPLARWGTWSRRRKVFLIGGTCVVLAALALLLVWLLVLRGNAPAPPSVGERLTTLETSTTSELLPPEPPPSPPPEPSEPPSPPPPEPSGASRAESEPPPTSVDSEAKTPDAPAIESSPLDGRWIVDTTIGDYADFTSSFAGYRVGEELANIGVTEAVGRTPEVSGSMEISGSVIRSAEVEVDLASLVSDRPRRDSLVRASLAIDRFPTARFSLSEPLEMGGIPEEGEEIQVLAQGEFTVHGVTRPVEVSLEAAWSGEIIVVGGSFEIRFEDFGISPPQVAIVLSVADVATVEWLLNLTRGD